MRKSTHMQKKAQISFAETADHTFVFAKSVVQFFYVLSPNVPASSHLLCLYSSICVVHVRRQNLSVVFLMIRLSYFCPLDSQ